MALLALRSSSRDPAVRLLRIGVAALLFVHGVFRVVKGGVAPFGEFLTGQGMPLGFWVAALLSAVEIVGAPLLAAGMFVRALVLWFAVELIAGIVLVHAREGWFVVGGGRNGVEYSVALLLALVTVVISEWWWEKRAATPSQ